ncbi:MAG: hypothetical protein C0433_14430 [Cyclobacterium sp.]|nr:hypothetical protein [Cyclobacterium sp.]
MKAINQNSANVSLGKRLNEDTNIFHPIHYKATGTGNWYEQDLEYFPLPNFNTEFLPEKIQLEHCFKAKIVSDYLLTFQNRDGLMKALTGLRKTIHTDWYYGDLRAFANCQTIMSLVLIHFSPDRSVFKLYLFESYYPEGGKRITEINKIIQEITLTGLPPKRVLKSSKWTPGIIDHPKSHRA